jgi:hypothetical protein
MTAAGRPYPYKMLRTVIAVDPIVIAVARSYAGQGKS